MGGMNVGVAGSKIKYAETRAVITRADGTVEDLGIIASYHRNPFKRFASKLRERLYRG